MVFDQPLGDIFEIILQRAHLSAGLRNGTCADPIAFDGVDDANFDNGLAPGQNGVQPGVVIFNVGILLIPRGLIADGSGIVPS